MAYTSNGYPGKARLRKVLVNSSTTTIQTETDTLRGLREEAAFFRSPRELFGFRHLRAGQCIGGLVVCSPLLAESVRNYRREVELGRRLAGNGVAVQRFDYFGTGRSRGDSRDTTFESMVEDALAAAEELVKVSGDRLAFLGTRAAAVVAAAAAARLGGAPLVLWEPAVDTRNYWRDAFRARLMYELKEGSGARLTDQALIDEIRDKGYTDVVGYRIDRPLYDSVVAQDLRSRLAGSRPVLFVDINRSGRLPSQYSPLIGALSAGGFDVTTRVLNGQEAWWFGAAGRREDEARVPTDELLNVTTAWLTEELSVTA